MSVVKKLFETEGDVFEVEIELHACDAEIEGSQGHLYIIEGAFTIRDLLRLAYAAQAFEAPDVSTRDWFMAARGAKFTDPEGESDG